MNPDTGMYEKEALIRDFALANNVTESEAARRILGGDAVKVEATEAEMERLSAAVKRARVSDLDDLDRLREAREKLERRSQ